MSPGDCLPFNSQQTEKRKTSFSLKIIEKQRVQPNSHGIICRADSSEADLHATICRPDSSAADFHNYKR